jgi:prepilin-type N-terminal cleavage/methylation domain-containing protein
MSTIYSLIKKINHIKIVCGAKPKQRKGYTLVEVFISIAILSLIVGAVYVVLNFGTVSWHSEVGLLVVHQQARQAIDGMSREIRQSKESDITINVAGDRIDFFIPDSTNSISYYISSGQIVREHPIGTQRVLLDGVTSLDFSPNPFSGDTVQIDITATRVVFGRSLSVSLTQKVRLRNE